MCQYCVFSLPRCRDCRRDSILPVFCPLSYFMKHALPWAPCGSMHFWVLVVRFTLHVGLVCPDNSYKCQQFSRLSQCCSHVTQSHCVLGFGEHREEELTTLTLQKQSIIACTVESQSLTDLLYLITVTKLNNLFLPLFDCPCSVASFKGRRYWTTWVRKKWNWRHQPLQWPS